MSQIYKHLTEFSETCIMQTTSQNYNIVSALQSHIYILMLEATVGQMFQYENTIKKQPVNRLNMFETVEDELCPYCGLYLYHFFSLVIVSMS